MTAADVDTWDSLSHIRLIVAVEERFGSWMTQYAYANWVTQAKLLEMGKVQDGAIVLGGRRLRGRGQRKRHAEAGHQRQQPRPAIYCRGSHCPPAFQVAPNMRSLWCKIMASRPSAG